MNGAVIVVDLADWLVIAALIANVICSVLCVIESRRIRKRKPLRVKVSPPMWSQTTEQRPANGEAP